MSRDERDAFIQRAMATVGWAVEVSPAVAVTRDPAFAYTIGLYKNFQHPELIVVGLAHDVMTTMLNMCGERIKAGRPLPIDAPFDGILADYQVRLREISSQGRKEPMLQLVWPDKHGLFPDEPGASRWIVQSQPLLP